ncbi:MAG: type II methionyl aminopeptidase [Methanobacterium sp.]|jgi:methionyl aminopeptidase|nr:type II methionyl aminopeptidase [Methanobacterium sp.]
MDENYEKSGKIVSKVRKKAMEMVKEDLKVLDLVEFTEQEIRNLGGEPAFPCNVSINEITAHYTSPYQDKTVLKLGDLVKIDLGAHVDGYIADSAVTVIVGGESIANPESALSEDEVHLQIKMIETVTQALENAISTVKDGVNVGEIGRVVEETVTAQNLKPVSNLTGHSMERYILHSGLSIPNIKEDNRHKIMEGDVLAIEPFVTNGVGLVTDMKEAYIFRFLRDRPLRMAQSRKMLQEIVQNYRNLPFAGRWLQESMKSRQFNLVLRNLISSRALYPYHVLKEKSNARVAQAEHTVIVEPEGCRIITK